MLLMQLLLLVMDWMLSLLLLLSGFIRLLYALVEPAVVSLLDVDGDKMAAAICCCFVPLVLLCREAAAVVLLMQLLLLVTYLMLSLLLLLSESVPLLFVAAEPAVGSVRC